MISEDHDDNMMHAAVDWGEIGFCGAVIYPKQRGDVGMQGKAEMARREQEPRHSFQGFAWGAEGQLRLQWVVHEVSQFTGEWQKGKWAGSYCNSPDPVYTGRDPDNLDDRL